MSQFLFLGVSAIEQDPPINLFITNPTQDNYEFYAKGPCYLISDLQGTDYSSINLDGTEYQISYGFNMIPIKFTDELELHSLNLINTESQYFDNIVVEPLFIKNGTINVGSEGKFISFNAGGQVTILIKPDFLYNWLFVKIDDVLLKDVYNPSDYPEIDSQLYSYFVERGAYISFDVELEPGEHTMFLAGDGDIEYRIMVNSDWDEDYLEDIYEVQNRFMLDLDPEIPDVWGFFERSSEETFLDLSEESQMQQEGLFSYYVPTLGNHYLTVEVFNGEYFDFEVDGTSMLDLTLTSDYPDTPMNHYEISISGIGWHYIRYKYRGNFNKISFRVDGVPVKVVQYNELNDMDGDGMKDAEETNLGLAQNVIDNDDDGLPDNYDPSPLGKLIINPNKIHEMFIPHDPNKNSKITIQIKKPLNDYSTNGVPRLWHDNLNVSIFPVLRLFGNEYKFDADSPIDVLTGQKLKDLWGKDIQPLRVSEENMDPIVLNSNNGDGIPNPTNPNNEIWYVMPNVAEYTLGYEFNYPRNHPAKEDGFIDLRFDFIWLVTKFDPEINTNKILHLYNFEEAITIQAFNTREIGDINYILATPDSYIENQILFNLVQNPSLGTFEEFGVDDDVIGNDTIDYNTIATQVASDLDNYYQSLSSVPNELTVIYYSGLEDNYDILDRYNVIREYGIGSSLLKRRDTQTFFSFYSMNNAYEQENITAEDPELQTEYKVNYIIAQNIYDELQHVAVINEMPLSMEKEVFDQSEELTLTQAVSEPIPIEEIPSSLSQDLNSNIKLFYQTWIEKTVEEDFTTINFDYNTDLYKAIYKNLDGSLEQGNTIFNPTSTRPSIASLLVEYIDEFRLILENIQANYHYFSTEPYYSGNQWNIYRDFDDFLNTYVDENGQYLTGFLEGSADTKLMGLNNLDTVMSDMIEQQTIKQYEIMKPPTEDPYAGEFKTKFDRITSELSDGISFGDKVWDVKKHTMIKTAHAMNLPPTQGEFKLKGWDRLKYSRTLSVAVSVGGMFFAIQDFYTGIVSLFDTAAKGLTGLYEGDIGQFFKDITVSICVTTLNAFSLIEGVIEIADTLKDITSNCLTNAKNFMAKTGWILSFVLLGIDIGTFFAKANSGELKGNEYTFQAMRLTLETSFLIGGLALSLAIGSTGVGLIVSGVVAGLSLLGQWLESKFNDPSIDVQAMNFYLNDATTLNVRRHGSLEIGNSLNYHVRVKNDGSTNGWIRASFRTQNDKYGLGWVGPMSTHGIGDWSDMDWPWSTQFTKGSVFDAQFSSQINGATPELHYYLNFGFDWERFRWLVVIPSWWREEGVRETIVESTGLTVVENTISAFNATTTELKPVSLYKEEFSAAKEAYRYKDATEFADEIISIVSEENKIYPDEFNFIKSNVQLTSDPNIYELLVVNPVQFYSLIDRFYDNGFRAKTLIPFIPFMLFGDKFWNAMSYLSSLGAMYVPKQWVINMEEKLADAIEYENLRDSLPIHTNIGLDIRENLIDLDLISKITDARIQLYLDGQDNPGIDIKLTPPEGFSLSSESFSQQLKSDIMFTIYQNDPTLLSGVYYIKLELFLQGELFYEALVPIRIRPFSNVEIIPQIISEIIPGEIISLIEIINSGTIPESLEVYFEGLPDNFTYKEYNPDQYIDSVRYFNLYPGDIESCFIQPPRHYSTKPGIYEFIVTIKDSIYGEVYHEYSSSLEIAEFYDMELISFNPTVKIKDSEMAILNFEVINLGNTEDTFSIDVSDLSFIDLELTSTSYTLQPGQSQYFEIYLNPIDLGDAVVNVVVSSDHISKEADVAVQIEDDDTNAPWFEEISITDDFLNVYISFYGKDLKEGDDVGLNLIEIYVDDLIITTYTCQPDEEHFFFTLENSWIMQIGQHEVKIKIWDADDDRLADSLYTIIDNLYFEITYEEMVQYVKWEINELSTKIQDSPDSSWKNNHLKNAMKEKLDELLLLIEDENYLDAYDKVLHDIKPLLTGLKTDENEVPWDGGVFKHPWVIDVNLQLIFKEDCNMILRNIQTLYNLF